MFSVSVCVGVFNLNWSVTSLFLVLRLHHEQQQQQQWRGQPQQPTKQRKELPLFTSSWQFTTTTQRKHNNNNNIRQNGRLSSNGADDVIRHHNNRCAYKWGAVVAASRTFVRSNALSLLPSHISRFLHHKHRHNVGQRITAVRAAKLTPFAPKNSPNWLWQHEL